MKTPHCDPYTGQWGEAKQYRIGARESRLISERGLQREREIQHEEREPAEAEAFSVVFHKAPVVSESASFHLIEISLSQFSLNVNAPHEKNQVFPILHHNQLTQTHSSRPHLPQYLEPPEEYPPAKRSEPLALSSSCPLEWSLPKRSSLPHLALLGRCQRMRWRLLNVRSEKLRFGRTTGIWYGGKRRCLITVARVARIYQLKSILKVLNFIQIPPLSDRDHIKAGPYVFKVFFFEKP